jgi:hypothetical protein
VFLSGIDFNFKQEIVNITHIEFYSAQNQMLLDPPNISNILPKELPRVFKELKN